MRIGTEVSTQRGRTPLKGVKQKPWWPFLKFEHHMDPLLHCLIEIGNNLLGKFCDVINEFIEKNKPRKIKLARAHTNYNLIIIETIKKRDAFDEAPEGKKLKSLQVWLASPRRTLKTIVQAARTNNDDDVPPSPPTNNMAILHADI